MKTGWKLVGHGVAGVVIVAACLAQKPDNWKGKAPQEWKFELVSAREIKVVSAQPKDDKTQVCGYVLSRTARAVSP